MKSAKKILTLILAGVMALALLTGCGKATSPDRAVAEGMADWIKYSYSLSGSGNTNKISVSYQVPELSRNIAPLFDTNWMHKNGENPSEDQDSPNKDAVISGTTTVADALQQCLRNYKDASCTLFYATDVTECAGFTSPEVTQLLTQSNPIAVYGNYNTAVENATHLRIAAAHKTIGEQTFLLAVVITEA